VTRIACHSQPFNFRNLGVNEGLPSGKVHAVTQDKKGFMYFATNDGLVRYDGERMKLFKHQDGDSLSLPKNSIKGLLTDKDGKIWCTHDKLGVSCFDPLTGKFRLVNFKKLLPGNEFAGYINDLYQNDNGKIFVCTFFTKHGIVIIDPQTMTSEQFLLTDHDPQKILTPLNNDILDLHFYNDSLWLFGTHNGLVFYNPLIKSAWKCLKIDVTNSGSWKNLINGFVKDSENNFYFGSWTGGLHYYDFQNGAVSTYVKSENSTDLEANSPKYLINDSILVICGWDLFYFNTHSKKIIRESPDLLNKYSFPGRTSNAYRASDGSVWLSMLTGVSRFHPGKNDFKTVMMFKPEEWLNMNPGLELFWLAYDRTNREYVINYFLKKEKETKFIFSVFDEGFKHRYDISNPLINRVTKLCFAGNDDGKIFFSGDENNIPRLYELNLHDKKVWNPFRQYSILDSLIIDELFIHQDTLFVISLYNYRILKFNIQSYQLISNELIGRDNKLSSFGVNAEIVFERFRNRFWVASETGIHFFQTDNPVLQSPENDSLNALLKNNKTVYSLTFDKKNQLWFSFSRGIVCYNISENKIKKVLGEKELPSLNSYYLVCDSSGNIWSDCSKGLMRINPGNYIAQLYNSNNGLQEYTYPGNSYLVSDGNLVKSFAGGLVLYDTRKQNEKQQPKTPVITSVKIFEREYEQGNSSLDLKKINLSSKRNSVTIEYAPLNYSNESFTQYAYRLEGASNEYVYTNSPQVLFSNLSPGDYAFHLKCSWGDDIWSNEKTLNITIHPPWYQTWWFRALLVLTLLFIVLAVYRYRISRIRKEEHMQTDFRKQLMDMEMTALRSQMNPHFIFNSLNSINRYVMQNDRLTASEYIAKFGKLIRNVLDNSTSRQITLEQELSTLELYIQLEKLRFENKFDYKIITDGVDASVKIPPMLIQPFVENSIWHGLMQKNEKGSVVVSAAMKMDNLLELIIEDDGIGRKKAEELKSKTAVHKSHGMKVTTDRIKIINELYEQKNKVEVVDLFDKNGNACGTKVILLIPIVDTIHD